MNKSKNRIRIFLLFALLSFLSGPAKSNECGVSKSQFTCIEGDFYSFLVGSSWRKFGPFGDVKYVFEASGKVYPPTYQNSPLIVTVAVIEKPFDSLATAKADVLATYSDFEDRVWRDGYIHTEESVKLNAEHDAWFLKTQFYRTSKSLYQDRYELVSYSSENKLAVIFSVSIQHGDSMHSVAEKLEFKNEIVDPIFESVKLK